MTSPIRIASSLLLLCFPLLGACAATDPASEGDATESDELAAGTSVGAHVPGMTVWLDPVAVAEWRYEQWVWVVRGRTSKNLAAAFSYSGDDEFGEALVTSKRKFEFVADGPSMIHLLEGHALFIQLDTTTGSQTRYFATVEMSSRFARFTGSSKIFVHQDLDPIVTGGRVLFRSEASTSKGVTGLEVSAPVARPEETVFIAPSYRSDWTWPNLLLAAEPPADPIQFTGASSSGSVAKEAGVDVAVGSLTLSTTAPSVDPVCEPSVLACLQGLSDAAGDTSVCGQAGVVQPCMYYLGPLAPSAATFASDLTLWLGSWYADHGQDALSSGGAALLTAQAAVHAAEVAPVTDPAADPQGHDLSKLVVFSHPDVVWPGSDRVWFGAYDRATGNLQSIYDFN